MNRIFSPNPPGCTGWSWRLEPTPRCSSWTISCGGCGWSAVPISASSPSRGPGTRNLAPRPDDPNAAAIRADYWMEDDEGHMDVAVGDVMPMGSLVSYECDYGSTTGLFLENLGRHGDLVGLLRPRQPWHGDRITVLARNEPDEECVACGEPARWRLLASDSEACEPIPFCDECRPEAGRYQLVMNSPREGTDCYDNMMSWDGMPIGEPDF